MGFPALHVVPIENKTRASFRWQSLATYGQPQAINTQRLRAPGVANCQELPLGEMRELEALLQAVNGTLRPLPRAGQEFFNAVVRQHFGEEDGSTLAARTLSFRPRQGVMPATEPAVCMDQLLYMLGSNMAKYDVFLSGRDCALQVPNSPGPCSGLPASCGTMTWKST